MQNINNIQTSSELRAAYKIKRHLNASLPEISPDKLERLRAGREQALTKQKQQTSTRAAVAGGGSLGINFGWAAQVVPLVVLVIGLFSINYWHRSQYTEEAAEIDVQMLTDELPPTAYLDRGFGSWLKRENQ